MCLTDKQVQYVKLLPKYIVIIIIIVKLTTVSYYLRKFTRLLQNLTCNLPNLSTSNIPAYR